MLTKEVGYSPGQLSLYSNTQSQPESEEAVTGNSGRLQMRGESERELFNEEKREVCI
jgi:hypothetical protein